MGLLRRGSVLLLAVLLVPLLRFIDLDAGSQPDEGVFAADGLSKHDPTGIVVDRKERTRFVTRIRAAQPSGDDNDDAWELERPALRKLAPVASVAFAGDPEVLVRLGPPRGTPRARGPPA